MARTHPIDHGYAWVVCFGAATQQFYIQGGTRSLGILFIELIAKYNANPSVAALAMALVAAGFSVFAALGNGIGRIVTYRKVAASGGITLFLSLFITAFAPNIYVVIVALGLGSGAACGLMFGPSLVVVGQYFDKRRALANGLALSGGSIGQLVIPMYLSFVIRTYGYQGALILYAALALHSIPGALLLRPPEFFTEPRTSKLKKRKKKKLQPIYVDTSTQTWTERGIQTAMPLDSEPWFSDLSQVDQSTQADIPAALTRSLSMDQEKYRTALLRVPPYTSQPNIHRSVSSLWLKRRGSTHSSRTSLYHAPLQDTLIADPDPRLNAQVPEKSAQKPTIGLFFMVFFRNLFDKEVLSSPLFWMCAIATSFGHCGYMNALMFLPSYTIEIFGPTAGKETAALLLSIMGITDLCGRIGGGLFADTGVIRRTWLCALCFLISGAMNILVLIKPMYGVLIGYAAAVGVFGGTYMALLPVIIVDLCGMDKLSAGVGLATLIMGLFIMPVPSALGFMAKHLGTYVPVLQLCGGMLVFAFVIYAFDPCCWRLKKYKDKKRDKDRLCDFDGESLSSSKTSIQKSRLENGQPKRHKKRKSSRRDSAEGVFLDREDDLRPVESVPYPPWAADPDSTARLAAQVVLQLHKYGQGVYTPEEMARIAAGIVMSMSAQSVRPPAPTLRGPGPNIYDIPETII